ncbi:hypothetical protein JCM14713_11590 [Desulfomicrobium salsuginis]
MQSPVSLPGGGARHDLRHQGAELRGYLRKAQTVRGDAPLGHDDNVRAQGKVVLMEPEELPDQTFDPVATHGLADFSAHRQSKTPGPPGVFPLENKEAEAL